MIIFNFHDACDYGKLRVPTKKCYAGYVVKTTPA